MMIAVVILLIILFPLLWILFVPVNIEVNTQTNLYVIQQPGTVRWSLHPGESPSMTLRILGFPVNTTNKPVLNDAHQKRHSKKSERKIRKSLNAWLDLFSGMISSFRCRRFVCKVDFDDVVLNAQLLPVGHLLSRGPILINVNFEKKYLLDIWLQARLHRMLWALLRFYLTK